MKKRVMTLVMALVMILGLVGCGGGGKNPAGTYNLTKMSFGEEEMDDANFIVVKNTLDALQQLAAAHRRRGKAAERGERGQKQRVKRKTFAAAGETDVKQPSQPQKDGKRRNAEKFAADGERFGKQGAHPLIHRYFRPVPEKYRRERGQIKSAARAARSSFFLSEKNGRGRRFPFCPPVSRIRSEEQRKRRKRNEREREHGEIPIFAAEENYVTAQYERERGLRPCIGGMQKTDRNGRRGGKAVGYAVEHDFEHAARKGEHRRSRSDAAVQSAARKEKGHRPVKNKPRAACRRSGKRKLSGRNAADEKRQQHVRKHLRGKIDRRQKPQPYERKTVQPRKRDEQKRGHVGDDRLIGDARKACGRRSFVSSLKHLFPAVILCH